MSNLDSLSFALSQISHLVNSINKKNFKSNVIEINHLVNQHGEEAVRHLIRALFSSVDFQYNTSDGKSNTRDYHQTLFLREEVLKIISKPNFIALLCYAIDNPLHHHKGIRTSSQFLTNVSKVLKLNRVQEAAFGLALLHSTNCETRKNAEYWTREILPELLRAYVESEQGQDGTGGGIGGSAGFHEISIEIVHLILTKLRDDPEQFGVETGLSEAFLNILRKDFPKQRVPVVLSPLLYSDTEDLPLTKAFRESNGLNQVTNEIWVTEILEEIGYSCTATLDEMRITMAEFSARELTPASVARTISMFMRTSEGEIREQISLQGGAGSVTWKQEGDGSATQSNSWNIDNFFSVVSELNPQLNGRQVVADLDHPGFSVSSKMAFSVLKQCISRLTSDKLPVELFYKRWQNIEGQFSLLQKCWQYPDVMCLAYWPYQAVDLSRLKQPPDEESNRDIQIWKNLDFVDILLELSDFGIYKEVSEVFQHPVQNCPEIFVLSLLQTRRTNNLKLDFLWRLFHHYMNPQTGANSASIFQYAWSISQDSNLIRTLIMQSMTDYYAEGDAASESARLCRIFDIIADVKALNMLMNASPHTFVLDLAVMGTKREYIKLQKWLSDRLQDGGETFALSVLAFLQRRAPRIFGMVEDSKDGKVIIIDNAIVNDIFQCLQQYIGTYSKETQERITSLCSRFWRLCPARSLPPTTGPSVLTPGAARPMQQTSAPPPSTGASSMPTFDQLSNTLGHLNLGPQMPATSTANPTKKQLSGMFADLPTQKMSMTHNRMLASSTTAAGSKEPPPTNLAVNPRQPGPMLSNQPANMRHFAIPPELDGTFNQQCAREVTQQFGNLFSSKILPDQYISDMKELSRGNNPSKRETLRCFLRYCIDEFTHVPKEYPEGAASIMAEVYGCIINEGTELVSGHVLTAFIRLLLISLTRPNMSNPSPYDNRLFDFGIIALNKCKHSLKNYKVFGQLSQCSNLSLFPKDLQEIIHFLSFSSEGSSTASSQPPLPSSNVNVPSGRQLPMSRPQSMFLPTLPPQTTRFPSHLENREGTWTMMNPTLPTEESVVEPTSRSVTVPTSTASQNSTTGISGTNNVEIQTPPEAIADKVMFLFNNMSLSNVSEKAKELKEAVPPDYAPWVAQYMVMKRVSAEPNFHSLFVQLIDCLDFPDFPNIVLQQVFRNIKVLMQNLKPDMQDFNDRTLFKNLGHFLGLLTLGKNRPILYDEINMKDLIYEAYHKGMVEMIYVIPFVARTLEGAKESIVFRPPNPWTMGLLKVMKEAHGDQNIRMNLKFEIELLCKQLSVDFAELQPSNFLHDTKHSARVFSSQQLRQDKKEVGGDSERASRPVPPPSSTASDVVGPLESQGAFGPSGLRREGLMSHPSMVSMQLPQLQVSSASQPVLPLQTGHLSVGAHMAAAASQSVSHLAAGAVPGAHIGSGVAPRYRYSDIDVGDPAAFDRLLVIDDNLTILKARPQLKPSVRMAVERTISEVVPAVVERCNRIILTTVEHIIRKDFAFDAEESRVKQCAQGMTRFLASGMALITGREALMMQLANNLKNVFLTQMSNCTQQQKEMAEHAASQLALDNVELCIAYVQKTVAETCIRDVDSRLAIDYTNRQKARAEKRPILDPVEWQYQMHKMPDSLRKVMTGPQTRDLMVYNEFQRNIPGFLPMADLPAISLQQQIVTATQPFPNPANGVSSSVGQQQTAPVVPPELTNMYDKIIIEIERQLTTISTVLHSTKDRLVIQLRTLIDAAVLAKSSSLESNIASRVVYKTIMSLMDNYDKSKMGTGGQYSQEILERFKEAHLHILRSMLQPDASPYGLTWVNRQTTKAWMDMDEQSGKWNADAFVELLKIHVINLSQLDHYLVSKLKEHNESALHFTMTLMDQLILLDNREFTVLNEWDVFNTLELINSLVKNIQMFMPPFDKTTFTRLTHMNAKLRELLDFGLLEGYHSAATVFLYSGCSQAREFDDPPQLSEKSEFLMRQYMEIYNSNRQNDRTTFQRFVSTMQQYDILKSDETITRFFRLTSGFVIERCLSKLKTEQGADAKAPNVRMPCYLELDAYAHLVTMLVSNYSNDAAQSGNGQNAIPSPQSLSFKVNLLNKVLGIVAGTLLQEHDVRPDWFHAMPFHRLFIMLFVELTASGDYDHPVLGAIAPQLICAFVNTLHILRPSRVPMFAYAWIEIISHRVFIDKLLASSITPKTHPMFAQLMVDLLKFLGNYLLNNIIPKPICFLYKGTLRVLLVLIHDFPEFISDYHALFCDIIPINSIQLRNLVLSAMPKKGVIMIDPFKANLSLDSIDSIVDPSGYCATADSRIRPSWLKQQLDAYLNHRQSVNFLTDLIAYLKVSDSPVIEPLYSTRYNVEVINALVLYLAITAIKTIREKNQALNRTTVAHTPQMDILQNLVINLDNEGRYYLLNAMANQLRYLNSHTLYFYLVFCYLFLEVENSSVREQITRVLMERLLVQRPHPWGLLRTFYEIMEKPTYKFWENEFARSHPDIERMLESVPQQCWPHMKGARAHLLAANQDGANPNAIHSSSA